MYTFNVPHITFNVSFCVTYNAKAGTFNCAVLWVSFILKPDERSESKKRAYLGYNVHVRLYVQPVENVNVG